VNVVSGDDSDDNVMTLLNDVEQVFVKVEAPASDVNKLSAALNADDAGLCSDMQITSSQFCLLILLQRHYVLSYSHTSDNEHG